jgi:hypothetical protein
MPTMTFGPFTVSKKLVNTRIYVNPGDRVGVVAGGEVDFGGAVAGVGAPILTADGDDWPTDAEYPAPNLRKNSLICNVGGTWFQGGVSESFIADAAGPLRLCPNDKNPEDNSRGWEVTVYRSTPPPPSPGAAPPPPPDPVIGNWSFYTLDGVGGIFGADCGFSPSVVLFNGRLHVFYGDLAGRFKLRHLDFDPSPQDAVGEIGWGPPPPPERDIDVLDGDGGANGRTTEPTGWVSSAIVHDGQIHVFYAGESPGGPFTLRHASSADGSAWQFEVLDGTGGPNGRVTGDVVRFVWVTLSAVSVGGNLHVFYFGATDRDRGPGADGRGIVTGTLRHATLLPSGIWQFEVLDGEGGANGRINAAVDGFVGHTSSAVIDQNGRIHLFYSNARPSLDEAGDEGITNLRYAWSDNGTVWQFQTIDGQGGGGGRIRALVGLDPVAIEYQGKIHVFYRDETNENVRYVAFDGNEWRFEGLDGTGGPNGRTEASVWPMAAAKLDDRLSLFCWNNTNGDLRHGYWMGENWQFETIDGEFSDRYGRIAGSVGIRAAAIAPTPSRLAVFYRDQTNTDLRYAAFSPRAG